VEYRPQQELCYMILEAQTSQHQQHKLQYRLIIYNVANINICAVFFYRFVDVICITMGTPVNKRESLGSYLQCYAQYRLIIYNVANINSISYNTG
jgi:hypothetical protein